MTGSFHLCSPSLSLTVPNLIQTLEFCVRRRLGPSDTQVNTLNLTKQVGTKTSNPSPPHPLTISNNVFYKNLPSLINDK